MSDSDDNNEGKFNESWMAGHTGQLYQPSKHDYHAYELGAGRQPCFPASTLISTPTGSQPIAQLKTGDYVLSWSDASRALVARRIRKVQAHAPARILEVELADGRKLRATGNHKMLTGDGWKRVDRITTGDELITETGAPARVLTNSAARRKEPVFNIVPEGEHTFVADGVVAHSFSFMRPVRHALNVLVEEYQAYRAHKAALDRDVANYLSRRANPRPSREDRYEQPAGASQTCHL